ncbi:MAG: pyridoxamine 5'-phosphate oxidase family protein [Candidatus Riflebacteria bacterium]|nr:pyridoxamine 5'-phosphate oxidase family protein [Candidatus Riflebacteria bacterium]
MDKKPVKKTAKKTTSRTAGPTLKTKIIKALTGGKGPKLAALATVTPDGNPWVRTMMVHADGLTLYSATSLDSRKIGHIKNNPSVALTISLDPTDMASPYLVIDALAEILTDRKVKKAHWSKGLAEYFEGPDDPNYCILKYSPRVIEYMGGKGPEILKVK